MNARTRRRLDEAVRRWALRLDGPPMPTPSGWVAFGRRGTTALALKLIAARSDEGRAAAALRHFAGHGSVRLVDHADGALLLERAVPGRPLADLVLAGRDDDATNILCDVAAALHRPPAPEEAFPRVEQWGRGFDRYRRSGAATIAPALVERAAALFAEFAATQGERRLLHGDLHHDNILRDARRGWLAIDPKGVVGEPAYELGAALRNPAFFPTPAATDWRSRIMAERLGLGRERILAWAFAQAVLSAVWAWEDGTAPDAALAAVEATAALVPPAT
jgi:streptomycin 6-kinase